MTDHLSGTQSILSVKMEPGGSLSSGGRGGKRGSVVGEVRGNLSVIPAKCPMWEVPYNVAQPGWDWSKHSSVWYFNTFGIFTHGGDWRGIFPFGDPGLCLMPHVTPSGIVGRGHATIPPWGHLTCCCMTSESWLGSRTSSLEIRFSRKVAFHFFLVYLHVKF
jgi:hypothetical protein